MIVRIISLLFFGVVSFITLPIWSQEDSSAQPKDEPSAEPERIIDRNRERDDALASRIPPGEVKWLKSGDSEFLVRFKAEETGQPAGSLMIVSNPMQTILAPGLMTEVISYFPSVSWHVMAVHPVDISFSGPDPVSDNDSNTPAESNTEGTPDSPDATANTSTTEQMSEAEWYEKQHKENQKLVVDRLAASEKELLINEKGYVLIVSSYSASLVLDGIKEQKIKPRAVILLDIDHPVKLIQEQLVSDLKDLRVPVLDVYHSGSKQLADRRKPLSTSQLYTQRFIPAVSSDFKGSEMLLMRTIRGWLKKNVN